MTYPATPIPGAASMLVVNNVNRMKMNASGREAAMKRIKLIRAGRFREVWPDMFSESIPTSITANFVDVAARDLSASLSNLPSLAVSAGTMNTEADRKRAQKKNRIGSNYWHESKLEYQMKWAADRYLSYGFLPAWVEADWDRQLPIIHLEDPNGSYYELDRWLDCVRYARVWRQELYELAALFPDYAGLILNDEYGRPYDGGSTTEVIRYIDDKNCLIYLPERQNVTVASYAHGMPSCPVVIALRPGLELEPRGQYDDVLFVQMAKGMLASLTLEAGFKAVQAPIVVPSDVNEIPTGPDAVIVTDQPDKVQRVALNVPNAAFALNSELTEEMHEGAGYPNTRMGIGPAGGSTGRGISALEGGYNDQIRLGQDVLGLMLRLVTSMCFKMEYLLWPKKRETIEGVISGESFRVTYSPGIDLAEDVKVEVTYGFATGMSQNSMIVTMLQLQGAGIIGDETLRDNLPFDIDGEKERQDIHVQRLEDAMLQGVQAGLTEVGALIASGNLQAAQMMFQWGAGIIAGRQAGKDLASLVVAGLQPPQPAEEAGEGETPGAPGAPGAAPGGAPDFGPGVNPNGLPFGTAQGQAGMAPGGRPSIQDLVAGFTAGGAPNLQATVRRRVATG